MSNEITSHYETVDFSDPYGKSAPVKEVVLQAERLEQQLKKAGQVELTSDTLYFIMDQGVRQSMAELMQDTVRLDLGEKELPLLFRSALLEAYLQEKLAQGLSGMETIDIALNAAELKTLSENKGTELLESLRRTIAKANEQQQDATRLQEAEEELAGMVEKAPLPYEQYEQIFGRGISSDIAALTSSLGRGMSASDLTVPPSQGLQADHLGGRSSIDMMMHMSTRPRHDPMFGGAEEAYSNDRLRWIFDGGERGKSHQVISYSGEWYKQLAPNEQRYINGIVLRNLADAFCIDEARALFPKEVPPEVFMSAMMQNSFGFGAEIGVRSLGEETCQLDLNTEKPLDAIARGTQAVLDAHRATCQSHGLTVIDDSQVASQHRRRRQNISLFSLLGNDRWVEGEEFEEPIATTNLWEHLEITDDEETQEKLYQAFVRRFGEYYRGTTPERSYTHSEIRLTKDGKVTCRYVDSVMYTEESDEEPWDLFEASAKKDKPLPEDYQGSTDPFSFTVENDPYGLLAEFRAKQVRTGYFHPNISKLAELLRDEAISFDQLLAEARTVAGDKSIEVEKSLLWSLNDDVRTRILDTRERLILLHEYVTPDQFQWLKDLELEAVPPDTDGVQKAYKGRLAALQAHPDQHHGNPQRMQEAVEDFKRLTRARDELLSRIDVQHSKSISAYTGKPLDVVQRSTEE
ncbi:MAG: hypothetical protein KC680_02770 [Candidatus Peregrinibacteria bacterium]|nr:hypothetical protein [Candidatus Peregrinibacteria bacterium]MCB9807786.1 hypothetical protein [Candidatus Peribacteria bacterium]